MKPTLIALLAISFLGCLGPAGSSINDSWIVVEPTKVVQGTGKSETFRVVNDVRFYGINNEPKSDWELIGHLIQRDNHDRKDVAEAIKVREGNIAIGVKMVTRGKYWAMFWAIGRKNTDQTGSSPTQSSSGAPAYPKRPAAVMTEAARKRFLETKAKSEAGDAYQQALLGTMYAMGYGVVEDDKEAVKWLRRAAEQGNSEAQYELALMYRNGEGTEKDDKEAVSWYRKAAKQGNALAQTNLGLMYAKGCGAVKDDSEAVKWFRKAAEQGFPLAQTNLGLMYANGEGVLEDDKEAVKWFRKAAEQGDPRGQGNLGVMYFKGEGVLEDFVMSYAWLNIAAANGDAIAKKNKTTCAKKMTPDQIAEAQKLSRELLRKIEANKAGKPKTSDSPFGRPLIDPDTGLPIIERR